jgi:hypothetical protein
MPTDLLYLTAAAYLGATAGTLTNLIIRHLEQRSEPKPRRPRPKRPRRISVRERDRLRAQARAWAAEQGVPGFERFAEGYVDDAADDYDNGPGRFR